MHELLSFFINLASSLFAWMDDQIVFGGASLLGIILATMITGIVIRSFVLKGR